MQPGAQRRTFSESGWTGALAGVLIVLAAFAAYHNCFTAPFVFDDEWAVIRNPTIRDLRDIGRVLAADTGNGAGVRGRPLVNLSLAVNYTLGETDVRGYHAFNLAFHALSALLLFGIVRRTLARMGAAGDVGRGRPTPPQDAGMAASGLSAKALATADDAALQLDDTLLAFAVALLWTVHPLQTETVTCVIQRTESLMGFFYLLTLYLFVRGVASARPARWQALTVAACLAGMACKEVMVSAPLLVLLYDRTFVAGSFAEAWRRRRALYLSLAGTWLLLGFLVVGTGGRGGTVGFGLGVSPWAYALTQCRAIVMYLKLSIWPHPLVLDYGIGLERSLVAVLPQALLLVLLVAGTAVALRRRPALGLAGAWFFVILAPSSSVIPLASQTIAEHRMYLPLAAVVALAVLGLHRLAGRRSLPVLLALALGLGWLTVLRNEDYRDEVGIWRDTVAKVPDSARARYDLGLMLEQRHRTAEAVTNFQEALRLKPDYAEAHNNLGSVLFEEGRVDDAVAHYVEALAANPSLAEAHYNLGRALFQLNRLPEAIDQYEQALRLDPEYADALINLGIALAKAGRTDEAIAHLREAVRLAPREAEAHYNLARALDQTGRLAEAVTAYQAALRLQPDFPEAHNNLAYALVQLGRAGEAISQIEQAVRLKPDDPNARINLASLLLATGRRSEAIASFETALRLAPDDVGAHFGLAQALLQENRGPEAVRQLREVLRLKPDFTPARELLDRLGASAPRGAEEP
jgi:tetratricopeptide (TPR) repeat protein